MDKGDPQLSPKVKDIVLDKMDIESQILQLPEDPPSKKTPAEESTAVQKMNIPTTAAPMNTGEDEVKASNVLLLSENLTNQA